MATRRPSTSWTWSETASTRGSSKWMAVDDPNGFGEFPIGCNPSREPPPRRGPGHDWTVWARAELGVAARHLGKTAEAESLLAGAVEDYRRAVGTDHPQTRKAMKELAAVYADEGRHAEAEDLYREVVEGEPCLSWRDPEVQSEALYALAVLDVRREDRNRAIEHLRQAVTFGLDATTEDRCPPAPKRPPRGRKVPR